MFCHYFYACMLLSPMVCTANEKDNYELLKQVALANKANQEAIMTWKGRVSFVTFSTSTKLAIENLEQHYNIEYTYDRFQDKTLFVCTRQLRKGIMDGNNIEDNKPSYYGGLRLSDGIYTRGPWQAIDEYARPNLIFKKRDDSAHSDFSIDYIPFRYFNVQQMDTFSRMMFFYEHMKGQSAIGKKVTRRNNIVSFDNILTSSESGVVTSIGKYEFDLSRGGNPILVEVIVPDEWHYKSENTFELINNIWVPKTVYVESKSLQNGKVVDISRVKIDWKEQQLNMEIDPQVFDLEKIGVQQGDRVIDRRTNVEYRYDESLKLPGVAKPGRFWTTAAVLGMGGAALLIALLVLWLRRRKRRRADHAMA